MDLIQFDLNSGFFAPAKTNTNDILSGHLNIIDKTGTIHVALYNYNSVKILFKSMGSIKIMMA